MFEQDTTEYRTVSVTMRWEETFEVEIPKDAPEVTDIDEFMEHHGDVAPFDPMTVSIDIQDYEYESVDE